MLAARGIIAQPTSPQSSAGWPKCGARSNRGAFEWSLELRTCISTSSAGSPRWSATPASACIPARSRNDQVATDVRLWLRAEIDAIDRQLDKRCERALLDLADAPRRSGHAGLHASAGRAAGDLRPSPAGLFRDVRARRRAACGLPRARQPPAAGRRGAGRHHVTPSIARGWRASSASTACARTRSTPSPTAISRSNSLPAPRWS